MAAQPPFRSLCLWAAGCPFSTAHGGCGVTGRPLGGSVEKGQSPIGQRWPSAAKPLLPLLRQLSNLPPRHLFITETPLCSGSSISWSLYSDYFLSVCETPSGFTLSSPVGLGGGGSQRPGRRPGEDTGGRRSPRRAPAMQSPLQGPGTQRRHRGSRSSGSQHTMPAPVTGVCAPPGPAEDVVWPGPSRRVPAAMLGAGGGDGGAQDHRGDAFAPLRP